MKRIRFYILPLAILVLIFGQPTPARAGNCSNPTGPEGQIIYSATYHVAEFCNGTNWLSMYGAAVAGGGACSAPSGLSFTNLTAQSLSTSVTSNTATITFTGCSVSQPVSVTGAATAQISINGAAWATSGAIYSGQTLQVRLTSSGTANTMLTATVAIGSSNTNWTVTTRLGSLNVFMTAGIYIGGTIGSLGAADALCQSEAGTAGYAGTYKAIMSDATTSAASRLTLSYPIVNAYDGSTVASSNLWIGTITNYIRQPSGGGSSGTTPWTGTNADGSIATNTCVGWTSTGSTGAIGRGGQTNGSWILYNGATPCTTAETLLCIQQ